MEDNNIGDGLVDENFEEVLSKKSKRQRLQQLEEEKRREEEREKERERQERINARKAKFQPKRIDKNSKRG